MTKTKYIIAGIFFVFATIVTWQYSQQKTEITIVEENKATFFKNKLDKKSYPEENFWYQRSYPDFDFSMDTYVKSMKKAIATSKENSKKFRQNTKVNGSGYDTPWKLEGPTNIGGRINTVISHPQNPNIIYAGCAKGGVFRTLDNGESWQPIFDEQPFLAIGHIAFNPQNPDEVFVATGDPNISISFAVGDGIYKSSDGGQTWENIGLAEQRIATKIRINPDNPDVMYVGTMGDPMQRDGNRGLYRTEDGGQTWEQILFVADDAGIIDLVMHPENPDVLFAASWNRIRNTQESIVEGDDAKIWRTTDGGDTWEMLQNGLPQQDMCRIGLTISNEKVFAVYVNTNYELDNVYVSSDNGDSWAATAGNAGAILGGFGWYFGKVVVNPTNDDHIYVLGVDLHRSLDGGQTWELATPSWWSYSVHADKHSLHFSDANTLILATDGGLYRSTDNAETWTDIENIPNTQFYRVAYNPHNPSVYGAGAQDNGITAGNADIMNEWPRILGGDGFQMIYHPTDPNIFYAENQNGAIYVTTDGGFDFSYANNGIDGSDRTNWDTPYIMSHHNSDVLYQGTFRLYKNESPAGQNSWFPISEDLTDGNIFGNSFHTITCIAESPLNANHLYVGTSDANVWHSLDGGETWESLHDDLPEKYITSIEASPNETNTVYVTMASYKGNGTDAEIYRSTNNGYDWNKINGDLPAIGVNDVMIYPNTAIDSLLFAATDIGIYATTDGETWNRVGSDFPYLWVFDIEHDVANNRIIAGTFARSLYSFPIDSIVPTSSTPIDTSNVGILENTKLNNWKVYPNPAENVFYIEHLDEKQQMTTAWISDLSGRKIKDIELNDKRQAIDISDFAKGVYLVHFLENGSEEAVKMVKR